MLDKIIRVKRVEIAEKKKRVPLDTLISAPPIPRRPFKAGISEGGRVNLIAEIKKASPSAGLLRENFDPSGIARIYQEAGARAISVLTDETFFKGSLSYLEEVREASSLPILRKDFIVDEYQIYESAAAGCDAILLIAAVLDKKELVRFLRLAEKLELATLVEVHTEDDLDKALAAKPEIIGVNNRNLTTFRLDKGVTERLIKLIPSGKTIVSESGIESHQDILRSGQLGVNAVLIGEAFMRAEDIAAQVRQIMG